MNTKKNILSNAIKIVCLGLYAGQGAFAASGTADVIAHTESVTVEDNVDPYDTKVTISTRYGEIDWDNFDIGNGESIHFDFSQVGDGEFSSSHLVINRVLNVESSILGTMSSDGHVVLINPRGVMFSESSTVNVAALTVSGLASTVSYVDGDGVLQQSSDVDYGTVLENGSVSNLGNITAQSGGVTLIGNSVHNLKDTIGDTEYTGSITATRGTINMIGAGQASISIGQDGLVSVAVESQALESELGLDAAVLNDGILQGANVIIEARVADDLFTHAVNNTGTITASGIDVAGGTIKLSASSASDGVSGSILNDGRLESATGAVSSDHISISGDTVTLGASSELVADATLNEDGGRVFVSATNALNLGGSISAIGNGTGFSGGSVSTRVDGQLGIADGDIAVATAGQETTGGGWRIGASAITVENNSADNIDGAVVEAALGSNAELILDAENGSVVIDDDVVWTTNSELILEASQSVSVAQKSNGQSNHVIGGDAAGILSVSAVDGFTNAGSVDVTEFELSLGVTSDTGGVAPQDLVTADLGEISSDNTIMVEVVNGTYGIDVTQIQGVALFEIDDQIPADDPVTFIGSDGAVVNAVESVSIQGASRIVATDFSLHGSDGDDSFALTGDGVVYENVTFDGVTAVDALGGTDAMVGSGSDWAIQDASTLTSEGISFTGLTSLDANGADLLGTTGNESFILNVDGSVDFAGTTISALTRVDGNGGTDSLTATAYVDGLALSDTAGELTAGTLTFVDITNAAVATLTGTSGVEQFTLDNSGNLTLDSASFVFTDVTSLVGGGGADTFASTASASWALTDSASIVNHGAMAVQDINILSGGNGTLTGHSDGHSFTITGDNALDVGSLQFSGISSVNADTVAADSIAAITAVTLGDSDGALSTNEIAFTGIDSASATTLNGADSGNTYALAGSGALDVAGISFTGLAAVNAGSGGDIVNSRANQDYVLNAGGSIQHEDIAFSGVESFAGTNADLNASNLGGDLQLTGNAGEVSTGSATFSGLDSATASSLLGDVDGNTVAVIDSDTVDVLSMSINGVADVTVTNGGTVNGADGLAWLLVDNDTATNNGIAFHGFTNLVAENAGLTGTTGDDTFVLTGDADNLSVGYSAMTFTGLNAVDGNGATTVDLVNATGFADGLALSGMDGEVVAGSVTFSNIDQASTAVLAGSNSGNTYVLAGAGALEVAGIDVTGLTTVNTGSGSDVVESRAGQDYVVNAGGSIQHEDIAFSGVESFVGTNADLDASNLSGDLQLTGNAGEARTGTATFSGLDSATATSLRGDLGNNEVSVINSTTVNVLSMSIDGVADVTATSGGTVNGADGLAWLLVDSDSASNNGIEFHGFTDLVAVNAGLVGTTGDDTFSLSGDADNIAVGSNSMVFTGVTSVDGNGALNGDQLDASSFSDALTLTGIANTIQAGNGFIFSNINSATAGSLIGSGSDWAIQDASTLASDGISFTGLTSLDANGADLLGTTGNESFTLNVDDSVDFAGTTISALTRVDGNGGTDSLTATAYVDGLALSDTAGELTAGTLTFVDITNAAVATLTGTSGVEQFALDNSGNLTLDSASFVFTDVTSLVGGGGADTFASTASASWALTDSASIVNHGAMAVQDINILSGGNGTLTGHSDGHSFTITGDNALDVGSLQFSGISSVNADTVAADSIAAITAVTLGDSDGALSTNEIAFTGIDSASATTLNGADSGNTYALAGSGALDVAGISFTGLTAVNAGSGGDIVNSRANQDYVLNAGGSIQHEDIAFSGVESFAGTNADLNASNLGGDLQLTGNAGEVSTGSATFSGLDSATASSLLGDVDGNTVAVIDSDTVDVLSMSINGVADVTVTNGGTVNGADGLAWLLVDNDTATNNGIAFHGFTNLVAENAGLTGTTGDDTFVLTGDADNLSVGYSAMTFTGLDAVDGNGATSGEHLDASGFGDALLLTGTDNTLQVATGFTFSDIATVSVTELIGHGGNDTFTVTGSGTITTAGMSVSGLVSVSGAGTDINGVNTLVADGTTQLLEEGNGANTVSYALTGDIRFYDIGRILAELVEATDGDDLLAFTDAGNVTVNGVEVGSSTFVDARAGNDTVTGLSGQDWLLLSESSAVNNGVTFDNVEILLTQDANLVGSDFADTFTLNSDGSLSVGLLTVSGMLQVLGEAGSDTLDATEFASGLTLTSTADVLSADGLLFSGIESVEVASLTGTDGAEQFSLEGDGTVTADTVRFSGVTSLDGAGGEDSFNSAAAEDWLLTSDVAQVNHGGLSLTRVENLAGGSGRVQGDASGHAFSVMADNALSVGDLSFTGVSSVDAASGEDSVEALNAITLTGNSGAFNTSEIAFTGIESAVAQSLIGSAGADTFELSGSGALSIFEITFSGLSSVDASGGNDEVISRSGLGYALGGDNHVQHEGIVFTGAEQFTGTSAALDITGQASAEIVGEGAVFTGGVSFSGIGALSLQDPDTDLQVWNGASLVGSGSVVSGGVDVSGVTTVSGTDVLTGTSGDDTFTVQANNSLSASGILFSDVNTISAGAGEDTVVGLSDSDWELLGSSGSLSHSSMTFDAVELAQNGSGHVIGADSGNLFAVAADGTLRVDSIAFSGVNSVVAGTGADSVSSASAGNWVLGDADGSAAISDIAFSGIEVVATESALVDGSQNSIVETYELSADGNTLSVLDILFESVSEVISGNEAGDQIASATSNWQVDASGSVTANGVLFAGVDQVVAQNAGLGGTGGDEEFVLTGLDGGVQVGGVEFSGIESVAGSGGNDTLVGTDGSEKLVLNASGDMTVAGTVFTGISRVDTAGGEDIVTGGNGRWTSATQDSAVIENSAVAQLDSISVIFENLEQVSDTGIYSGPDLSAGYALSGPARLTMGGVSFTGVESIVAGSGSDTLYGMDAILSWTLGDGGNTVSNEQFAVAFSGFEHVVAGAAADTFHLEGGAFTTVSTGAGNDVVYMSGTLLDSLVLGAGDDLVQLLSGSEPTVLSAGAGSDRLEVFLTEQSWQINGESTAQNAVGNFLFSGFEQLADTAGGLSLVSNQQLDFTVADSGAGINFGAAGMTLEYDPAGDLSLTSASRETIGGSLLAENVEFNLAGDLDIEADVQSLYLSSGGTDINVSIVANEDLLIDQVDVGRGSVSLTSANFGSLTAETFGDTHITAATIQLGSDLQRWGSIGTEINPLRMDASQSVDIVALSYFEPAFVGSQPEFTATGDQLESVAGAQTAQGLKSAIQNPVDDIAQLDPGIFSEVTPYSLGIDALNLPEVRLHGGELLPMGDPEEDDEQREKREQRERGAALNRKIGAPDAAQQENAMLPPPLLESAMAAGSASVVGGR
ncbi:filamentous hemagglutinin N-terminal domain-containing protein [Microbulbifer agarilyticus]|uniref:filamentous hemagglutinin N-terminal domain-containing protein n=1 Tax=Microbulbifer agarilyticus TaxID=260552 RepID=UPI001C97BF34|nr:filamentous hemagglutinin N-terminal domain-containing protein [Microbulbifer agarilyticus]MBY6190006.1 filamentous hemagglutinin N-terminal domain-containing protein [Microbulbifer agarilyticus]